MDAKPILLPYQQRWVGDDADIRICEKSRRVGISWATAAEAALDAGAQNGMDVWYIGYTKDMAQEFIRDCGTWLGAYQLAADAADERPADVARHKHRKCHTFDTWRPRHAAKNERECGKKARERDPELVMGAPHV